MKKITLSKMCDINSINRFKKEIYDWAVEAFFMSGFCKDVEAASLLCKKKIIDVFENDLSSQHCFNIYVDEKELVGKVWLMERQNEEANLRISYIGFDPSHQRKGYAAKVFSWIEGFARERGFDRLSLNVFSHLPHARRLYSKLGFVIAHEVRERGRLVTCEMIKIL